MVNDSSRIDGEARDSTEIDFYYGVIHPQCPACDNRSIDTMTDVDIDLYLTQDPQTGNEYSAGHCDATCSKCGYVRRIYFRKALGYPQVSLVDTRANDEASRVRSRHLGGPAPSQLISPVEFATALASALAAATGDFSSLTHEQFVAEFSAKRIAVGRAMTCLLELLKFIPDGADDMPDAHFRSDDERRYRADHPKRFQRGHLEAELARIIALDTDAEDTRARWNQDVVLDEAEVAARADEIVRQFRTQRAGATPAMIVAQGPLSQAALRAHQLWLADRGGQRLHATDAHATGATLSALDLSAAILERTVLDQADLSFTRLHGATLTEVRARGAGLASAMIAGTTVRRCDFTGAGMPIANLGDATIEDTDFTGADLERTQWYRSQITRCRFADAVMTDSALDHAVFVDCDLRGADLGLVRHLLGSTMDAQFLRCDLRDTNWHDRELFRVRMIDCKLAGARGTPRPEALVIERPDLSVAGDGSRIGTALDVLAAWGIDLHARPQALAAPDAPAPAR